MNIKSEKGIALALAMMVVIILLISSVGLYASVFYHSKETRIDEVQHIRGYYAAIAGQRYAELLLEDPSSIVYEADGVTVDNSAYANFFADLNIDAARLTITITDLGGGTYQVNCDYAY